MNSWPSWDLTILRAVNGGLEHPLLTSVMLSITEVDNWIPLIAAGVVLLLFAGRSLPRFGGGTFTSRNPRAVLFGIVLCIAIADPMVYQLKKAVGRTRPCRDEEVSVLLDCRLSADGRIGFPSSHAANSASMAVFVALCYPPLALPAGIIAFLVGFSRVYLAVHYPLDVIAGWFLGSLVGLCVFMSLRRPLQSIGLAGFANRFRYRQKVAETDPGGNWRKCRWETLDGICVNGWHLPGGPGILLFVHGLGGNMTSRAPLLEELNRRYGWGGLLVPLRGDSCHPVPVSSGGVLEALDVLGALSFAGKLGHTPRNCILYGVSMGGSAALKAAALAGDALPGLVVVHGAFTRFFTSAVNRLGRFRAGLLRAIMPARVTRSLDAFDTGLYASLFPRALRVVYISGERDATCPPFHGEEIMSRFPSTRMIVLRGETHPGFGNACSVELLAAFEGIRAMHVEDDPTVGNGVQS